MLFFLAYKTIEKKPNLGYTNFRLNLFKDFYGKQKKFLCRI